jgi:hypothetical protein
VLPFGRAEPGTAGVATNYELDLEELSPLLHGGGGRPNRRGQIRLALAFLLGRLGLLGSGRLRAGFFSLARSLFGFAFVGASEHL